MKKIVALILALVMVMGLATVASAATTTVAGNYQIVGTTDTNATKDTVTSITKTAAVTPVDVDEDGKYDEGGVDVSGAIEYYTITATLGGTMKAYQVASVDDADYILYVKDAKTPYMYLAAVPNNAMAEAYLTGAAVFTNFGKNCGQFNYALYDADETYYVLNGVVYIGAVNGAYNFMVGGEVVRADVIGGTGWVAHTPVYTQAKDGTVTAIKCNDCGATGVICANFAAVPTALQVANVTAFQVPGSATKWYYWAAPTVEAPEAGDKVESAQTFDAGIAMYVGMSVMAAAGSAVVLKKKD